MNEYGLRIIMFLVLIYRFFSLGAAKEGSDREGGREGGRRREKDIQMNSSAASVAPRCICGQAVSHCNYQMYVDVCVCVSIVAVAACQTAHSLCGEANIEEGKSVCVVKMHTQKTKTA